MEAQVWSEEARSTGFDMYTEGVSQVRAGDINLADYRAKFAAASGRPTTLTDDELVVVYMSTEDDDDDERNSYVSSAEAFFSSIEGMKAMAATIASSGVEPLTPRKPEPAQEAETDNNNSDEATA